MRPLLAAIGLALAAPAAEAYVGPGLGLGVLGAILGAAMAVLLAVAGVVWYPLKRVLKSRKPAAARRTAGDRPVHEDSGLKEQEP